MKKKAGFTISVLFLALVAASVCALLAGSLRFSLKDLFGGLAFLFSDAGKGMAGEIGGDLARNELAATVLFQIRLPRIALAIGVGASLSVAGAGFQALFRNSLADPFVIGASSGASLGAGLAMVFAPPLFAFAGGSLVPLAAFAGSLGAVLVAYTIARFAGNPPPATSLLLAGTSIGSLFSSLLSFILTVKDGSLQRVYYWLLGSFATASWGTVLPLLPVMLAGCFAVVLFRRGLDLLLQGEEAAGSMGLDVRKVRLAVILGASLATAATVAGAGIVGFVGLVSPHAARVLVGPGHRRLLPAAAIIGALLTVLADMLSRCIAPPLEIPVGIITSLGGAPFFLYLLARKQR